MVQNTKRIAIGATTVALSAGILGVGVSSASATPRISAGTCFSTASSANGYVIADPSSNTSCSVNDNGTALQVQGVMSRNGKTKIKALLVPRLWRGDISGARWAHVRYINHNHVITFKVKINRYGVVSKRYTLPNRGRWAVVVTYGQNTLSTILQRT